MGGGDLNLKKSWHPSTLRNIERVWKAEQKHEVEKQKIEQLQKELAEERAREEIQAYAEDQGVVKKKEERLDWMYQGPAAMVNREEYLMGRKIDKTFEIIQQQESGVVPPKEDGSDIGSKMFSSQDLSGTATVDLANKIREDPLFSIMKKEKEQRKNLLTNPVKMKQLQKLLQSSLGKEKSKKSKKNKRKKHEDDSDSEKQKKKKKHVKNSSSNSESEEEVFRDSYIKGKRSYGNSDNLYKSSKSCDKNYNRKYETNGHTELHYSSHKRDRNDKSETYGFKESHYSSNKRDRNDQSEINRYKESHYSSNSNYKYRNYQSETNGYVESSYSSDMKHRDRSNQSSYKKDYSFHEHYHKKSFSNDPRENSDKNSTKRKLNAEERERLLQEMQENAKWRDEQRKRNTKRYREDDEREANEKIVDTSDFLKPMLSKAAGKGSLENRVKQKIFTIQRNSADMDKNFARR